VITEQEQEKRFLERFLKHFNDKKLYSCVQNGMQILQSCMRI